MREYASHIGDAKVPGHGNRVENHTDALLRPGVHGAGELARRDAEDRPLAAIELDEAQQCLDGSRLAGAVLANEANDLALAHREAYVIERKTVIVLDDSARLDERDVLRGTRDLPPAFDNRHRTVLSVDPGAEVSNRSNWDCPVLTHRI